MPELVRITDVSPRDGLQNEPGVIPTADKARLVELLSDTGVDEVEVTSFVSRKWIPQLGDAGELVEALATRLKRKTDYWSALVPNEIGLDSAISANKMAMALSGDRGLLINKIAVFTSASETFASKNTNASIAETLERFKPVIARSSKEFEAVRGYVSCAVACPFEGAIAPQAVTTVAFDLYRLGCREIDLGDTIGAATPDSIRALLKCIVDSQRNDEDWYDWWITLHLHDTFGRAAECVKVALDMGVRSFDGSVAGLGGCPYASTPGKRAPGNIDTRLLVETIHRAGYRTNVDLDKLEVAGDFAREIVAKARASA
ncbi:MAG: hydroxymethylglutaryl-CoA lyase [Planctomycetota bacterium]